MYDLSIGDLMTIEKWLECVECGGFIDYYGFGTLLRKEGEEYIVVREFFYPSLVSKQQNFVNQATHINWYNR